jgi:hypothetical protein
LDGGSGDVPLESVDGADGAAVALVETFGWLLPDLGPLLLLLPLPLPLLPLLLPDLSTCETASTCSGLQGTCNERETRHDSGGCETEVCFALASRPNGSWLLSRNINMDARATVSEDQIFVGGTMSECSGCIRNMHLALTPV